MTGLIARLHLMAKACVPVEAAPRVFTLLSQYMARQKIPENVRERTHPTNPEVIITSRYSVAIHYALLTIVLMHRM